jgi:hypothetical protein
MDSQILPNEVSEEKDDMDALKALYDAKNDIKKYNMERSFITTLQTITLNILILGAYIASKIQLTGEAKILGSFLILAFNFFSGIYIKNKGDTHQKLREEIARIEDALLFKCPSLKNKVFGSYPGPNSFAKGTGILIFGILITCICALASFWIPLLIDTKSQVIPKEDHLYIKILNGDKVQDTLKIRKTK